MVNASSALLSHHHRALEENTKLDSEEITAEDIPQEEVDALCRVLLFELIRMPVLLERY